MSSKSQKPTAPIALSEEQKEAIQKEGRNNEAFGQRAKIALSLIPSLIKAFPEKSDAEIVERSIALAELFMDKLLGVKFLAVEEAKNEE